MRICMHRDENKLLLKQIYIFVPFSDSFGAIIFQLGHEVRGEEMYIG
jgi:hypothetical protein